jgi:hypothetical protein
MAGAWLAPLFRRPLSRSRWELSHGIHRTFKQNLTEEA